MSFPKSPIWVFALLLGVGAIGFAIFMDQGRKDLAAQMIETQKRADVELKADVQRKEEAKQTALAEKSREEKKRVDSDAEAGDDQLNCHNWFVERTHKTSQTRAQFALDTTEIVSQMVGSSNIFATARGEDNQYLLFTAAPDDEALLRVAAKVLLADLSVRANFCAQGFSEVQFLIRDEKLNQRVLVRCRPDFAEMMHYVQQKAGATPVH